MTLQPLRRFKLDAAILFSDILTIPNAMGLELCFEDGEGPALSQTGAQRSRHRPLGVPDPEDDLRYVMDAVRLIRKELNGDVPLIGFAGSPWTLATYMVEGCGGSEFAHVKKLMFDEPAIMHRLLDVLARSVTAYLNARSPPGCRR